MSEPSPAMPLGAAQVPTPPLAVVPDPEVAARTCRTPSGLTVVSLGDDLHGRPPPWSHSVGFGALDLPEVVVGGLPAPAAAGRLGWLHARAIAGRPVAPGVVERFGRCRVRLDPVPAACAEALVASVTAPVVQLVWADWRNVLPGEPGCDPLTARRQQLAVAKREM